MAEERTEVPVDWETKLTEIGLEKRFWVLMTEDSQREKVYRLLKNHISTRLRLPQSGRSGLSMDELTITFAWQIQMLIGTIKPSALPVGVRDSRGATLAHYAAWAGDKEALTWMEAQRHDYKALLEYCDDQGRSIKAYAAWSGDETFYTSGTATVRVDKQGRSDRLNRIISDDKSEWSDEECRALIERKEIDKAGRSAYYYSIWTKNNSLFKKLLAARFDDNIDNTLKAGTVQVYNRQYGYEDKFEPYLMNFEGREKKTLAHYAAWLGNVEALEALREKGYCRFEAPDEETGDTIAHYAALSGNLNTLKWVHQYCPGLFERAFDSFMGFRGLTQCAETSKNPEVTTWMSNYKAVQKGVEQMISDAEKLLDDPDWKNRFSVAFPSVDPEVIRRAQERIETTVNGVIKKRADVWIDGVKKQLDKPGWKETFKAGCAGVSPDVVEKELLRIETAFNIASHEMVAKAGKKLQGMRAGEMYGQGKEDFVKQFSAVDKVIVDRELHRITQAQGDLALVTPESPRHQLVKIGVDNTLLCQSVLKEEDFERIHKLLKNHTSDALTLAAHPEIPETLRLSIHKLKIEAVWQLNALAGTEGNLDPTKEDNRGANIAHYAAWSGNIAALNWIKRYHPALLLKNDKFGHNLYYYACSSSSETTYDWIKSNCSSMENYWHADQNVPAVISGNQTIFDWVMRDTQERQNVLLDDPSYFPLIYSVVWVKNNGFLATLIQAYQRESPEASLSSLIPERWYSLGRGRGHHIDLAHYAAWAGNTEALEILKRSNWKFKYTGYLDDRGLSIAHFAALSGNKETLSWVYKENRQLILDAFDDVCDCAKRSKNTQWIEEYKEIIQEEKRMTDNMKDYLGSLTWETEFTKRYSDRHFDTKVIEDVLERLKKEHYLVSQEEVVAAAHQLIHPGISVTLLGGGRSGNKYDPTWGASFRDKYKGVDRLLLDRECARIQKVHMKRDSAMSAARGRLIGIGVDDQLIIDSVLPAEKYDEVYQLLEPHTSMRLLLPKELTHLGVTPFIQQLRIEEPWQLDALAGERHLDPTKRDNRGANIAHYAAWSGNIEALEAIFDKCPALLTQRDNSGRTILQYAALSKDDATYNYIIRHYKELLVDGTETPLSHCLDGYDRGTAYYAVLSNNQAVIADKKDFSAFCKYTDSMGRSIVDAVIWANTDPSLFDRMLETNPALLRTTDRFMRPADYAALCGNTAVLDKLKEKGYLYFETEVIWDSQEYIYRINIAGFAALSGKSESLSWVYKEYPNLITQDFRKIEDHANVTDKTGAGTTRTWISNYKIVANMTSDIIAGFQDAHPLDVSWKTRFSEACRDVDPLVCSRHNEQITRAQESNYKNRMEAIFVRAKGDSREHPKVQALLQTFIDEKLHACKTVEELGTAVLQWHSSNMQGILQTLSEKSSSADSMTSEDVACYLSAWKQLKVDKWVTDPTIKSKNDEMIGLIRGELEKNKRIEIVEKSLERAVNDYIDSVRKIHPFDAREIHTPKALETLHSADITPEEQRTLMTKMVIETDPIKRMVDLIQIEHDRQLSGYPPKVKGLLTALIAEIKKCTSRDTMKAAVLAWHRENLETIKARVAGGSADENSWTAEDYTRYLSTLDQLEISAYVPIPAEVKENQQSIVDSLVAKSQIIETLKKLHPLDPCWEKKLESFCNEQHIEQSDRKNYVDGIIIATQCKEKMIGLIKSECSKLDEFPQVKLLFEDLCEAVSRPSISLKGVVVSWKLKNLKRTAGFDDRDDTSTTTPISLSTEERAAYRAVCQALMLEEDIELPEYRPTASPGAS